MIPWVSASTWCYGGTETDVVVGLFRVGLVEAVSTPPAMFSDHRMSDHLSYVEDPERRSEESMDDVTERQARIKSQSSLQPPSAGVTRSSYMTTSTNGSRMSGLSDFPAPPAQLRMTPSHTSLPNSYFESHQQNEDLLPTVPPPPSNRRMTFGGDEDVEDIAKALSSHL